MISEVRSAAEPQPISSSLRRLRYLRVSALKKPLTAETQRTRRGRIYEATIDVKNFLNTLSS